MRSFGRPKPDAAGILRGHLMKAETARMNAPNVFFTPDMDLAAFLLARRFRLIESTVNGHIVTFLFSEEEGLNEAQQSFWNNGLIGVRDFVTALETIRDLVKQKCRG